MFDGAWARKESIYGLDKRPLLPERAKDPRKEAGTPHIQPLAVGFLQANIGGDDSHNAHVSHHGLVKSRWVASFSPIAIRPSHRTAFADCLSRSTRRKRSFYHPHWRDVLQAEECRTCSLDGLRTQEQAICYACSELLCIKNQQTLWTLIGSNCAISLNGGSCIGTKEAWPCLTEDDLGLLIGDRVDTLGHDSRCRWKRGSISSMSSFACLQWIRRSHLWFISRYLHWLGRQSIVPTNVPTCVLILLYRRVCYSVHSPLLTPLSQPPFNVMVVGSVTDSLVLVSLYLNPITLTIKYEIFRCWIAVVPTVYSVDT